MIRYIVLDDLLYDGYYPRSGQGEDGTDAAPLLSYDTRKDAEESPGFTPGESVIWAVEL